MTSQRSPLFTFHTSRHEVSRIDAAMSEQFGNLFRKTGDGEASSVAADFVWLHKPSKRTQPLVEGAAVCSCLSGIQCLEDKASLALLQREMRGVPTLESWPVRGAGGFRHWCTARFSGPEPGCEAVTEGGAAGGVALAETLWIVKDAGANGAEGIWVFSQRTWPAVHAEIRTLERGGGARVYVVQEYVQRPALWDGRFKFHLRVYALLTAEGRMFLYRKAYAHVANRPFSTRPRADPGSPSPDPDRAAAAAAGGPAVDADPGPSGCGPVLADTGADAFEREVHITNVSANIHDGTLFHGTPIIDLPLDLPQTYARMQRLFAELARCAAPFLRRQLRAADFQHMGADVIIDEAGTPWLIEINAPPNMFSYTMDPSHPAELETHPMVKPQTHDMIAAFVVGPVLRRARRAAAEDEGGSGGEGEGGARGGGVPAAVEAAAAAAAACKHTRAEAGAGRLHCTVEAAAPGELAQDDGGPAGPDELVNGWEPVCAAPLAGDSVAAFEPSAPHELPLNTLYWHAFKSKQKQT